MATVRNQATISQLEADAANVDLGQNSQLKIMVIDLITTSHPDLVREAFDAAVGSSVKHIDVLVSNAGAVTSMGTALNTGAEDLQHHFQVNSIAPLMIFQAFWPLMQKSQQPKFVAVSSSVGSIEQQELLPGGAYERLLCSCCFAFANGSS